MATRQKKDSKAETSVAVRVRLDSILEVVDGVVKGKVKSGKEGVEVKVEGISGLPTLPVVREDGTKDLANCLDRKWWNAVWKCHPSNSSRSEKFAHLHDSFQAISGMALEARGKDLQCFLVLESDAVRAMRAAYRDSKKK